MSQMQTFDFLSSINTLEIPKSKSGQQDFFSEEDATAWAKEAEAAGLSTEEEVALDARELPSEESETAVTSVSASENEQVTEEVPDDFIEGANVLTGASVGLQMGDDLWTFQVVEEAEPRQSPANAEIQVEPETKFSFEPAQNAVAEEKLNAKAVSEVEPTSAEEIQSEASGLDEIQDVSTESIETEEAATEAKEIETYSFPVRDQNASSNTEANKSGPSMNSEEAERLLKNAASGESGDQSEFESGAEDMSFEDFSFTDDFEQIQAETSTFEHAGNDNSDSSINQVRGTGSASALSASKITPRMAASLTGMQARAEALANQDSFTLKGSDFGGDMDIRMRSTMKGLDLTLMPHLAAQANRLNSSLKTIKGMLNDRGIGANNVRMNTDQVIDPFEEQHNRFQDTALFSEVSGKNDNRVREILEVQNQVQNPNHDNEGDLA